MVSYPTAMTLINVMTMMYITPMVNTAGANHGVVIGREIEYPKRKASSFIAALMDDVFTA